MRYGVVGTCAIAVVACAHEPQPSFNPPLGTTRAETEKSARRFGADADAPDDPKQVGLATWYGGVFAGKRTASGERFDPGAMTAAHRKLPFGTWVDVRRVDTGRSVRVRINDRGPWGDTRRVIDLSRRAAEQLDLIREGTVLVEIRVVRGPG
jgi:rare lipoprotein A